MYKIIRKIQHGGWGRGFKPHEHTHDGKVNYTYYNTFSCLGLILMSNELEKVNYCI